MSLLIQVLVLFFLFCQYVHIFKLEKLKQKLLRIRFSHRNAVTHLFLHCNTRVLQCIF